MQNGMNWNICLISAQVKILQTDIGNHNNSKYYLLATGQFSCLWNTKIKDRGDTKSV